MNRTMLEARIAGVNLLWISASLIAALSVLCTMAGNLANLSFMCYEVVYPFYVAICVAEWSKTRTDPAFDAVAAQSKSLFHFVAGRFAWSFCASSLFAIVGIAVCCWVRQEVGFGHLVWVYLTTALLFGSLSALISLISRMDHFAVALTGTVWLFFMTAKAMLQNVPSAHYYYPFLRLMAPDDPIWPLNKAILLGLSALCWLLIFAICHTRRSIQD